MLHPYALPLFCGSRQFNSLFKLRLHAYVCWANHLPVLPRLSRAGLSVFGAGRTTRAINIQRFVVATQEGDDVIYLLASSPYCTTAISGGKGSDSIYLANAPPLGEVGGSLVYVDAGRTLGQSGILKHSLLSYSEGAADYDNVTKALAVIDGVHAFAMDSDTISVVLDFEREDDKLESTVIFENDVYKSNMPAEQKRICYTLQLTKNAPGPEGVIDDGDDLMVMVLVTMTMEPSFPIFLLYDENDMFITDNVVRVKTSTATKVCLRPNLEAFPYLNPDLSNHGERYVAISHQTVQISEVTAALKSADYAGCAKPETNQTAHCKENKGDGVIPEMPHMFFVRTLIYHETGVRFPCALYMAKPVPGSTHVHDSRLPPHCAVFFIILFHFVCFNAFGVF